MTYFEGGPQIALVEVEAELGCREPPSGIEFILLKASALKVAPES